MPSPPRDRSPRRAGTADGSRLKRVEDKLDEYTASMSRSETLLDEVVMPTVKQTLTKLDGLGSELQSLSSGVERIGESLEVMGSDLRRTVEDHEERISAVERSHADHKIRLNKYDETQVHQRVRTIEERISVEDAGDRRELALTKRRNRILAAIFATVSSVGGAIAGWLFGN